MTTTLRAALPETPYVNDVGALSSNERAAHLAGMDDLFSAAIRQEMVQMQEFYALLKRIGT